MENSSTTKFVKNIDVNHGELINAWIESMRASSPPKATSSCSNDNNSSIVRHPSALGRFDEVIKAFRGKQIVIFLDYDGTLSPIVTDPERAVMSKEMRETVRKLAQCFPTAIVSGRGTNKVFNFVQLPELYYAGSHGMDIKGPEQGSKYKKDCKNLLYQPAKEFLPMIGEVYSILDEKIKSTPGATVENNKFCLSVHFRSVKEKDWIELTTQVYLVLEKYPKLRLTQGRKVLEIRPSIEWDKGKAVEYLLEALGFGNCKDAFPFYIGDDKTDEDAFKVLRDRGQGLGILVSKTAKETSASYSLEDPEEVRNFLERLVQCKEIRGC